MQADFGLGSVPGAGTNQTPPTVYLHRPNPWSIICFKSRATTKITNTISGHLALLATERTHASLTAARASFQRTNFFGHLHFLGPPNNQFSISNAGSVDRFPSVHKAITRSFHISSNYTLPDTQANCTPLLCKTAMKKMNHVTLGPIASKQPLHLLRKIQTSCQSLFAARPKISKYVYANSYQAMLSQGTQVTMQRFTQGFDDRVKLLPRITIAWDSGLILLLSVPTQSTPR